MLCTAIHLPSKTILRNVESTKLNPSEHLINPDQTILDTPSDYWVVSGNTITIMDQTQKDAIDIIKLKIFKRLQLENWLDGQLDTTTTFTYSSNSYTFKFNDTTNDYLMQLYTMAKSAVDTSFATASKTYAVYDENNTLRNLNNSQISNVYARYATNRAAIYVTYYAKIAEIKNASTKAQVIAITIP